jgi:outer membrane biogenesis lipoprotein LolB
MKKLSIVLLALIIAAVSCTSSKTNSSPTAKIVKPSARTIKQNPYYEMRTYYAALNKLDDLSARFQKQHYADFCKTWYG